MADSMQPAQGAPCSLKKKSKSARLEGSEEDRSHRAKGEKKVLAKPPPQQGDSIRADDGLGAPEPPPVTLVSPNVWGEAGFATTQVAPPTATITAGAPQPSAAFQPQVPWPGMPQAAFVPPHQVAPPLLDQAHLQAYIAAAVQQYMAGGNQLAMMPQAGPSLATSQQAAIGPSLPALDQSLGPSSDEEREEGEYEEGALSEDEGANPDQSTSTSLFPPQMFSSLLRRARLIAGLPETAVPGPADKAEVVPDPLFTLPGQSTDVIPAPQLFLQNIQQQFTAPTAGPMPSAADKRFFNVAAELATVLAPPPTVDGPVAALHSPTAIPGEAEELLKPEERRIEQTLVKNHLSSAWAARASSAASFFSRSALLWLRQIQEQVDPSDVRLHQDIAKVIAANQFAADATLRSARYSAKAIASATVGRRLNWLRGWTADARQKWKLAATPIKDKLLFGTVLDPILVESKDRKKVMPALSKKGSARFTPYTKRPFRQPDLGYNQPRAPGQYYPRPSYTDRSFRGRPYKKPYRGATSKFPRKGK